ncbi:MAG: hypothetical protein WCF86_07030, partial [Pseudolabrys sp.]
AAPPRSVMKSRRLIASLEAKDRASYRQKPVHWKSDLIVSRLYNQGGDDAEKGGAGGGTDSDSSQSHRPNNSNANSNARG